MSDRPHISWSQISRLQTCGVQYENYYLKKIKMPPAVALIVGSAVHHSIECNLKAKIENGVGVEWQAAIEAARDEVNNKWFGEGVLLNDEETAEGAAEVRGRAVDTAVACAACHYEEVAPQILPGAIEQEREITIPGLDKTILAYVDIQETAEHQYCIHDTKTKSAKGRAPNDATAWGADQMTVYQLTEYAENHRLVPLAMDFIIKSEPAKAVIVPTERGLDDLKVMIRRIKAAARAIETGVFLPAPSDSWCCNPKYCPYFQQCPYARKRVVTGYDREDNE